VNLNDWNTLRLNGQLTSNVAISARIEPGTANLEVKNELRVLFRAIENVDSSAAGSSIALR